MCVTLCLSFTETSREEVNKESEFSMLSAVNMCAACFAVPSGNSRGQTKALIELLLTVSRFMLRLLE